MRIDVVSDVVCPWCFIGKRQLESALAAWAAEHPGQAQPEVVWHPFQLNPGMPPEGASRAEYLTAKFGSADTSRLYANVRAAAAEVALPLALERIARQPSTLRPHALQSRLHIRQQGPQFCARAGPPDPQHHHCPRHRGMGPQQPQQRLARLGEAAVRGLEPGQLGVADRTARPEGVRPVERHRRGRRRPEWRVAPPGGSRARRVIHSMRC